MKRIRVDTDYVENLEIKKVYIHPKFSNPQLHDSIAVIELGRRIAFDVEKVNKTM